MLRFRIGDCQVCISASFFVLITFVLIISDGEIVIISLLSAFLHELGHITAMRMLGDKIRLLSFSATGIRLDKDREKTVSYGSEIVISLAGVAVNFFLCLSFVLIYIMTQDILFRNISLINLLVGIFNLMPVEALDGARALYYCLLKKISEEKANRIIIIVSIITVIVMMICAVAITLYSRTNLSLIIVIIYLLILLINHIIELKK